MCLAYLFIGQASRLCKGNNQGHAFVREARLLASVKEVLSPRPKPGRLRLVEARVKTTELSLMAQEPKAAVLKKRLRFDAPSLHSPLLLVNPRLSSHQMLPLGGET